MWKFDQQPGNYFVVATLLPLVAFVLILLAFLLWSVFRRYRQQPGAALVYRVLGGDTPGLIPAFLATGAIALAFVFSLTGFAIYVNSHARQEASIEKARAAISHTLEELHDVGNEEKKRTELERKLDKQRETLDRLMARWNGHVTWLQLTDAGQSDPRHGMALTLGFHVDGLTIILFLMVTGLPRWFTSIRSATCARNCRKPLKIPRLSPPRASSNAGGGLAAFSCTCPCFASPCSTCSWLTTCSRCS